MFITADHQVVDRIRKIIDEAMESAPPLWTSGRLAQEIVDKLRSDDPELLTKWLDLQATNSIREIITEIIRHQKLTARLESQGRSVSIFTKAVERHEAGEENALGAWVNTIYVVNTNNTRKRLGDMEKEDLLYAASDYGRRAKANQMQATFLRALAERVGAGKVSDVFTDQELSRLWRSIE